MTRNIRMKRVLSMLLLLLCMANLLALPASATEVSAEVKVYQRFKCNATAPKDVGYFKYRLTYLGSNSDENPVKEKVSDFTMYRNDDHSLQFTFNHAGVYTYRLEPRIPDTRMKYVKYDKTVYTIRAYVSNENDGLKVKFTFENNKGDKVDTLQFGQKYVLEYEVPDTGDTMNLPLYISVMVLSAGAIIVLFLLKRKKERQDQDTSEELEESQEKTEE